MLGRGALRGAAQLVVGHKEDSWAEAHTDGSGLAVARTLDALITAVCAKVKKGAHRKAAERRVWSNPCHP